MQTAEKKNQTRGRNPAESQLAPTLGPLVCRWIERFLVHSEGDFYGKPFRLIDFHKRFIWRAYELNSDGSRKYSRAVLGVAKGNAKTEIASAIALCELAGPVVFDGWGRNGEPKGRQRTAPDIPIAAASFDHANLLFRAASTMITQGPLEKFFDVFDTEILIKGGPGSMYRVAAVAGTNDGRRPTFFVSDELHEWLGIKERVHLVLSNGRAKRNDAWELAISTAGWDMQSLLGKLYVHGKRVLAGEVEDPKFLFEWLEASAEYDLSDPEQLRAAIVSCNPGVGHWLNAENIIEQYHTKPEHEFRRYFLNQWTTAPERWLPVEAWNACHAPRDISNDIPIVLGFDGSWSGDSTAIMGCTVEAKPHLFVIEAWEKPEGQATDWKVDIPDVEQSIRNVCRSHNVRMIGCDPHRWQRSLSILEQEGLPIVQWPSHSANFMSPACQEFERAVTSQQITHDGDARLERHINNCIVKIDSRGPRITKDHKDSLRKIDIAVAGVIAHNLSQRMLSTPVASSPYDQPGFRSIIV